MKIFILLTTLFLIIYGLRKLFTRKPKTTIRYRYIPPYPIIEDSITSKNANTPDSVLQKPTISNDRKFTYQAPNQSEKQRLEGNIQRLFAFKKDKEYAIHKMRVKHPHANEMEILRLVDIEYRIKRG